MYSPAAPAGDSACVISAYSRLCSALAASCGSPRSRYSCDQAIVGSSVCSGRPRSSASARSVSRSRMASRANCSAAACAQAASPAVCADSSSAFFSPRQRACSASPASGKRRQNTSHTAAACRRSVTLFGNARSSAVSAASPACAPSPRAVWTTASIRPASSWAESVSSNCRSVSTLVPSARASGQSSSMSGQDLPVSHLLTAAADTPSIPASASCVRPRSLRSA